MVRLRHAEYFALLCGVAMGTACLADDSYLVSLAWWAVWRRTGGYPPQLGHRDTDKST
jgi:hypothetical protein